MTNGMKSSEFWVTLFTVVVASFLASKGVGLDVITGVIAPASAYIISRGLAKKDTNT